MGRPPKKKGRERRPPISISVRRGLLLMLRPLREAFQLYTEKAGGPLKWMDNADRDDIKRAMKYVEDLTAHYRHKEGKDPL